MEPDCRKDCTPNKTQFNMNNQTFTESHVNNKAGSNVFKRMKNFFTRNKLYVTNSEFGMSIVVHTQTQSVRLTNCVFSSDLYDSIDDFLKYQNLYEKKSLLKNLDLNRYVLYFNCKPLSRRPINLIDYGMVDGSIVMYQYHGMLGGSFEPQQHLPLSMSVLLEHQVMQMDKHLFQDFGKFELQAAFFDVDMTFAKHVQTFLAKYISSGKYDQDMLWLSDMINNIMQIKYWYGKCSDLTDFYHLTELAYKLITKRNMVSDILQRILKEDFSGNNMQADDVGDFLKMLRNGFDGVVNIQQIHLVKKLVSLYSYLLTQGFLDKFGIVIDDETYSRLEQKALYKSYSSKKDLWICVFDTVLFMCEKIHEFQQTGDISVFVHNSSEYSEWLTKADKILALAPFTSNLSAHGTTYFTYISDLSDAIEKGCAYSKFTFENTGYESVLIKKKLASLQLLKNTEVTRRSSQKERQAPFGVLVHGTSSVAKSTFTKMLFYYFGSLHGLNKDDHFRYVRNPADEYWSNFDTSKWCIQMDDIAFLLPNKASDADPTLMEMLNVVNNVPYVPPQAALEDKGKTPVMAKLVVATSNSADLNAHEYFWCPLAVRRRLPFVVEVKPKDKYLHENMRFIDPEKLPEISGEYPDFWHIKVSKLVPHKHAERDFAKLETVKIFDDIKEFLKFYGQASLAHQANQDKSQVCDVAMKDVGVCPLCLYSTAFCECSTQALPTCEGVLSVVNGIFAKAADLFVHTKMFVGIHLYLAKIRMYRGFFMRYLVRFFNKKEQMLRIGELNLVDYVPNANYKQFLCALGALSACVVLYYSTRKKEEPVKEEAPLEEQGNVFGSTEEQLKKETKQNVWYNDTLELSRFDFPLCSQSLVGKTNEDLRSYFGKNCVRVIITGLGSEEPYSMTMGAVFIGGHYCLLNNHAFRSGHERYSVEFIQMTNAQGITNNLKVYMNNIDIVRKPLQDLCLIEVNSLPPYKDIMKYWATGTIDTKKLLGIRRTDAGNVECYDIHAARRCIRFPVEALGVEMDIIMGRVTTITKKGDCGTLILANTPSGVSCVGIHMLGYIDNCGAIEIYASHIEEMRKQFDSISKKIIVQGGGEPMYGVPGKEYNLGPVHHRSLVRYMEKGNANIYGSFSGVRPKPHSRVCTTPLSEEFCEYYNMGIEHGAPVMRGWLPWHKNVVEMVQPNVNYNKNVLDVCVESFTNDIISSLPHEWEKELVFLSDKASVNGIPGVIYVDKINRNTSMGFPWCTSKKKYLVPDVCERYPEGITFPDEVWERVNKIKNLYSEGHRAFPIFSGHLKDEAIPLAKIAAGKTRMFTGSPLDWNIVVRSRLLSFIRLLQTNKFIFEAGPGTVCQSTEWGVVRDYLVSFGEDQMVAGDYGKFDKRMIADFILAAYRIICNIYRKAGFSEEEVREIACIGEDTAFPVVNVNGDLIEFFGTNPSGHPLTVIINSLVNSLYIRYCYTMLNPEHECLTFKQNVHLFTYGDDNIMGVSKQCPWFNHTSIQKELAQIGVEYTMADKLSASVPYININECSFLKRKWLYDEDMHVWMCPLEEASIKKSLTVWVPSKSIDATAQMVAVISSANGEYFFYGKKVFNKHHAKFLEILSREPYKFYVNDSTLPNWEELRGRYERASE